MIGIVLLSTIYIIGTLLIAISKKIMIHKISYHYIFLVSLIFWTSIIEAREFIVSSLFTIIYLCLSIIIFLYNKKNYIAFNVNYEEICNKLNKYYKTIKTKNNTIKIIDINKNIRIRDHSIYCIIYFNDIKGEIIKKIISVLNDD